VSDRRLAPWLERWDLTPDGEAFETPFGSRLMPVRAGGERAIVKIAGSEEERLGGALMVWWAGDGAARVLRREGEAILLERACGRRSLAAMAREGADKAAMAILCETARRLHTPRAGTPPASLVPLPVWFRALGPIAIREGGTFRRAWTVAEGLLAAPRDECVLHGDLHHDNVLDGEARGWLAIDPKGLIGERGFDYANMICNPDIETVRREGVFTRRIALVSAAASLEPARLLRWVLAYAGLSAAWTIGDGGDAAPAIEIARLAAAELGLSG
jgi:streptomycin 6-kinase